MGEMVETDLTVVVEEMEGMQVPVVMETEGKEDLGEIMVGMGGEEEMEMEVDMVVAVVMLDGAEEVVVQVAEVDQAAEMVPLV
ncbi:hypothetical protein [Yersinia mollaretii]|uniref:hypothetical protein n=1 Tax=Yersinia mollaretii TaxID=33060 RepID=UPI0021BDA179|nr:hypothetical protein [Yersinia mollaretii]